MKINKLKERLRAERPTTMVSLRIPKDVLEDLKHIAPLLGFSGYQSLIKAYIGQGLRVDLEGLGGKVELAALLESLSRQGVEEDIIATAIADAQGRNQAT